MNIIVYLFSIITILIKIIIMTCSFYIYNAGPYERYIRRLNAANLFLVFKITSHLYKKSYAALLC